jgi:hypothetical protein
MRPAASMVAFMGWILPFWWQHHNQIGPASGRRLRVHALRAEKIT